MQILSLFDGMACGMLAMQSAGISVDRYVAFEIDKYAVQTSSHNFPMIEHRGDVFQADFTEFRGFDFLVGGSPCTYWSIAQKNNRETEASGMGWELFCQYVRALHEAQPRFFIYENNKSMSKAIRASIDEAFGFDAVCINSALVSAQNRQRLYWVGKRNPDGTYSKVHVEQPEDRGILLRDVLDGMCWRDKAYAIDSNYHKTLGQQGFDRQSGRRKMAAEPVAYPFGETNGKAYALTASYWKGQPKEKIIEKSQRTHVAEPVSVRCRGRDGVGKWEARSDGKNGRVTANTVGINIAEPVGIGYRGRMEDGKWVKRYESNEEPKANALTTAQTDSMVSDPVYIGEVPGHNGEYRNGKQPSQQYRVYSVNGKSVACDTDSRKHIAQPVCDPVRVGTWPNNAKNQAHDSQQYRIYSTEGKGVTLCGNGGGMGAKTGLYAIPVEFDGDTPIKAVASDGKEYPVYAVKDGQITIKGKSYPIKLVDGFYIIRKLTVSECKRLQTVPEWYEFPVSDTQAYKMLGNGWTVVIIAHLIAATQADVQEEEQLSLFRM